MRHLNNGTDHRHSKSCCDQSSPARRTMIFNSCGRWSVLRYILIFYLNKFDGNLILSSSEFWWIGRYMLFSHGAWWVKKVVSIYHIQVWNYGTTNFLLNLNSKCKIRQWNGSQISNRMQSQRTHDAIITSLWRRNDVATSFWRHNDVIIASCARWESICESWGTHGTW